MEPLPEEPNYAASLTELIKEKATSDLQNFPNNSAALEGGLFSGDLYYSQATAQDDAIVKMVSNPAA